jgi:hypothetical protein
METFRQAVNECINIGLRENKTSMKSLSLACYPKLRRINLLSQYKLCAISRASGILANYRKLAKRHKVRKPYCTRPMLITCYGLRIRDGRLKMPGSLSVRLNNHTLEFLTQPNIEVRSVTDSRWREDDSRGICVMPRRVIRTLSSNLNVVLGLWFLGQVQLQLARCNRIEP